MNKQKGKEKKKIKVKESQIRVHYITARGCNQPKHVSGPSSEAQTHKGEGAESGQLCWPPMIDDDRQIHKSNLVNGMGRPDGGAR